MNPQKIVVHPGTAHGDDFLACCVLAAKFDTSIERREPTQADLDNPETLVLDVGGKYEPENLNFDHHQDLDVPCSLVLVLQWLGLHEKFQRAYRWYANVDFHDRRGAKALGEKYGLTDGQMIEIGSPVHTALIKMFEVEKYLAPSQHGTDFIWPVYDVMRMIGNELISYAEQYGSAWERIENCEQQNFRGHWILINPSDDITATGDYSREKKISIMASYDNRGAGWAILRTNEGEQAFDFNLVANDPRIAFAHKGGFIAKTRERLPVGEVFELIEKAFIA